MSISITTNAVELSHRFSLMALMIPDALDKGLGDWVVMSNHKAKSDKLNGENGAAGAYPVPVRTGQLKRAQDYILPNRSKAGVSAKSGEAYLFNASNYAKSVHDGLGIHQKFGARPFARDAIEDTREAGMSSISTRLRASLMGYSL